MMEKQNQYELKFTYGLFFRGRQWLSFPKVYRLVFTEQFKDMYEKSMALTMLEEKYFISALVVIESWFLIGNL